MCVTAGCSRPQGPISERHNERTVREQNLTLTPIVFATTDFYIGPTTMDAEEGRLTVPEHHDSSSARQYQVHFVRFAATNAEHGYPVVYLAGGPGGSGVQSASGDRYKMFMRLRDAGDVIAYSQRGTQFTTPSPSCPGEWNYPLDQPLDSATLYSVLQPFLRNCAAVWQDSLDISSFNTAENAEDLEDLRVALRVEKLNLVAISYGTHLALAYIRRHPDRVAGAVLAGVEGPDDTWKLPANIESVLQRGDSTIKADARAVKRAPAFLRDLQATLRRLDASPQSVEVMDRRNKQRHRVAVGGNDLRLAVFHTFRERQTIKQTLVKRVVPILGGDMHALGEFAYRWRRSRGELVMALTADCASGVSDQRRQTIRGQAATAVLGDIANMFLDATCAGWPARTLGDDFRSEIHTDVPVLAISSTLDNRTPPETAEAALRGFSRAGQIIIEGGSHDDDLFLSSPRIMDAMMQFLATHEPKSERIVLKPLKFDLP